jgi:hypothetical protein
LEDGGRDFAVVVEINSKSREEQQAIGRERSKVRAGWQEVYLWWGLVECNLHNTSYRTILRKMNKP